MSVKSIIIGSILVGIFTFAIIMFAYQLPIENGVNNSIANDPRVAVLVTSMNSSLQSSFELANSTQQSFNQDNPLAAFGSLVLTSIVGVVKVLGTLPVAFFNAVFAFSNDVLGIPPIVTTAVIAILVISIVLLAWRLYRIGS